MTIIEIPIKDNYLPHGYVLGYEGENLTTEIRIIPDEIITAADYRLEFNKTQGVDLKRKDDYFYANVKAEMLTVGEIEAQLVWTWNDVVDGEKVNRADKTNKAHWRVLDSIKLSEDLEEAHPEILNQIMADLAEIKEYGGGGSGRPGFSPIVEMKETEEGVEVTITDLNGEKTALVKHGTDGDDGFSPDVTLEEDADGVNITTTHKDAESTTVKVKHGKDGYIPVKDKDYFDGKDGYTPQKDVDYFDGDDGFSPEVTAEETETGVKITVTHKDAEPTVVEVKNGKDGDDYVITTEDYPAIAEYVLTLIEDGDTLTY